MPALPEGMQQSDGQASKDGAAFPGRDPAGFSEQEDTAEASNGVYITELGKDAWIRLGTSAALLTAGIAAALIFRRGRTK